MGVMANNIPNPPIQSQPQLYHLQRHHWHHHATSTVMLRVVLRPVGNLEKKKKKSRFQALPTTQFLAFLEQTNTFLPKKTF